MCVPRGPNLVKSCLDFVGQEIGPSLPTRCVLHAWAEPVYCLCVFCANSGYVLVWSGPRRCRRISHFPKCVGQLRPLLYSSGMARPSTHHLIWGHSLAGGGICASMNVDSTHTHTHTILYLSTPPTSPSLLLSVPLTTPTRRRKKMLPLVGSV